MNINDFFGNLFIRLGLNMKADSPEFRADVRKLEDAVKDFDNFHRALLPPDQAKIIDDAFAEVRNMVLEGRVDEVTNPEKGPLKKIYEVSVAAKGLFVPYLLTWSVRYHLRVVDKALTQNKVKDFFEMPYEPSFGPAQVMDLAIIGELKNPQVDVFIKEGNDLYTENYSWPKLRIIRDDKSPAVRVENVKPKVVTGEREIWTGDYTALTDSIYDKVKGEGFMLVKSPLNFQESARHEMITRSFFSEFLKYEAGRR